ncbi:MAG: DUF4097 family beta strand repeat-containing protein [Promethearchaeati archaeon]
MQKKFLAILFISAFFIGGTFIFGLIGFFTYGNIDQSTTYEYVTSGNETEAINLSADLSNINIKYNNTPMDDPNISMKADLKIHLEGIFVLGKKFSDFFNPITILNDSSIGLEIRKKNLNWFNPTNWFLGIFVNLTITLRTDLKYNITAEVGTGDIILESKSKVNLSQIDLKTNSGDIFLNAFQTNFTQNICLQTRLGVIYSIFNNSYLNGNLDLKGSAADLNLNAINFSLQTNSFWNLTTRKGDINIRIKQNKTMGADVDINAFISDIGDLNCFYNDTLSSVGTQIRGNVIQGDVILNEPFNGFEILSGNLIQSEDYISATYKFDIDLDAVISFINIYAESS